MGHYHRPFRLHRRCTGWNRPKHGIDAFFLFGLALALALALASLTILKNIWKTFPETLRKSHANGVAVLAVEGGGEDPTVLLKFTRRQKFSN